MRSQHLDQARQAPSLQQPLGTDEVGRSLLWRTLYGGAVSLSLGLLSAGIAVLIAPRTAPWPVTAADAATKS